MLFSQGDADDVSDLDLMVVEHELIDRAKEYFHLRAATGHSGVGVDLLLVSAQEFERRSQVPGTAAYGAKREGKVLDAATVDLAGACFHAQQAAEKSLKAVMCLRGLEFRRSHDLDACKHAQVNKYCVAN